RSAMEREQSEYENSIPSGATEVPATDTSVGKLRPSIKEDNSTKNNKTTDTKKSGDTKKSPDSDSGDRKSQPADTTDSTPASTSTSAPPRTTSSPSAPRIGDNTGKTQ
ncbi:MAG: LCP family protein, partial [Selenomonadaceae bacterium]